MKSIDKQILIIVMVIIMIIIGCNGSPDPDPITLYINFNEVYGMQPEEDVGPYLQTAIYTLNSDSKYTDGVFIINVPGTYMLTEGIYKSNKPYTLMIGEINADSNKTD